MALLPGEPDTGPAQVVGVGVNVGSYVLTRELGAGGMGQVFEAVHRQLGRRVAIKLPSRRLTASPGALRRFLREGRACARIQHPHVVEVLDTGVHDGQPYLVMDLVDGIDLGACFQQKSELAVSELVELFLPLCSALWTAHKNGVVHRDIKPANVLVTFPRPGVAHPVIVDFGISRLLYSDAAGDLTDTDSTPGTVAYMAPEQLRGEGAADPWSDQYSLGVMLYECATGQRPFEGKSRYDLTHAILHSEPVAPSTRRRVLPELLDRIVLRAMSKDPGQRYPSLHALGADLLSLGDARTWTLFGSEFAGKPGHSGATQSEPDDAPESSTLEGAGKAAAVPRSAAGERALHALAVTLLLGLFAGLLALALRGERQALQSVFLASRPRSEQGPASSSSPSGVQSARPDAPRLEPLVKTRLPRDPKPAKKRPPAAERGTNGALIVE
jgi:eukaryotic-like serine/threonine-protein kinase